MGDQVGVRDRPIHSGGEAAPSRSRPAPRRTSIHSGKDHSVADIASFLSVGEHLTQRKFLSVHEYSNVLRWAESLVERPAAQRGRAERLNMTGRRMRASGRYVRLPTAWSKAPISR